MVGGTANVASFVSVFHFRNRKHTDKKTMRLCNVVAYVACTCLHAVNSTTTIADSTFIGEVTLNPKERL